MFVIQNVTLTLIDIPIGLKDYDKEERQCDLEARKKLQKPRNNSIFPTPTRAALRGSPYEECCRLNIESRGKRLSKQSYAILPKIREVDDSMIRNPEAQNFIRETHPEICFWAFSGEPMKYYKKSDESMKERLYVLNKYMPAANDMYQEGLKNYSRGILEKDDILDSMVAAISAKFAESKPLALPQDVQMDLKGLRMEMVYGTPS